MQWLSFILIFIAGLLFKNAPDGVSIRSIAPFVLLIFAIVWYFAASARVQSEDLNDLGRELGLIVKKSFSVGLAGDAIMEGQYNERPVQVRMEMASTTSRYSFQPLNRRRDYDFTVTMVVENPAKIKLMIGPEQPRWNIYFGWRPPRIEGTWSWSKGFELFGEPQATIVSLASRIEPKDMARLKSLDWNFKGLSIESDKCAVNIGTRSRSLNREQLATLLGITFRIGEALRG